MLTSRTKGLVPRPIRAVARHGYYWLLDLADLRDRLRGKRDPLRPPRRLILNVGGAFEEVGIEFLGLFKSLAGLKPEESVLEIGCGVGRMAIPLARYMNRQGRYEGMDIVRPAVSWCREHITPCYPNFHFVHADIYNTTYNRTARTLARDYQFPYPSGTFDLVLLTSVFTHMLPADMKHYLQETVRVMRPGARCLITYFMMNEEHPELMRAGRATTSFPNSYGDYWTAIKDEPEAAVAFDEALVRRFYTECGLVIVEPIHFGQWSGKPDGLSFQDIVIAKKP